MRHRLSCFAIVAALGSLGGAESAHAHIYRCQGKNGEIHYTNVRPRGGRCRIAVRGRRGARPRTRAPHRASRSRRSLSPERYRKYDGFIREAASLYQLPTAFVRAVVRVESDFSPHAVSHAGAMGLMQLMPRTAAAMGVRNPFDPRQNVLGGTRYLRVLANKFNGDLVLTIAAYNAGEGAVMRHRGVPPYQETRRYIQRVLRHYYAFRTPASKR